MTRRPLGGAALVLSLCAAGCTSHAPPIVRPLRIAASCGTLEARTTGIFSVMSSTDDRLLDETPAQSDVEHAVARGDGAIAYWHEQLLALPRVSQALGESDGYARVDAAAIPGVPEGAVSRRIYLLVRDHGRKRWIALTAYDAQSVCQEGKRDV